MARGAERHRRPDEIRHIYLVGGSLTDGRKEGERFLQLARFVKQANRHGIPVSSARARSRRPDRTVSSRAAGGLVCFNLEMWSEPLFAKVCPGKNSYVGYPAGSNRSRPPCALGRGRVYWPWSRHRGRPEHGIEWEEAARIALRAQRISAAAASSRSTRSCGRWAARSGSDYHERIRGYFEALNRGYQRDPPAPGLIVSRGFMCHRCAYMQIECDLDRQETHERAMNRPRCRIRPDRPADDGLLGQPVSAHRQPAEALRPARRRRRRPPTRWRARSDSMRG